VCVYDNMCACACACVYVCDSLCLNSYVCMSVSPGITFRQYTYYLCSSHTHTHTHIHTGLAKKQKVDDQEPAAPYVPIAEAPQVQTFVDPALAAIKLQVRGKCVCMYVCMYVCV
jgi:hypothetical protein